MRNQAYEESNAYLSLPVGLVIIGVSLPSLLLAVNILDDERALSGPERDNNCINALTHSHTMTPFDAPRKQAF